MTEMQKGKEWVKEVIQGSGNFPKKIHPQENTCHGKFLSEQLKYSKKL